MFGQNSLYQEVGEYAEIRHENNSYVVISRDSTRFTKDYVLKQGFPNWYMLVYRGDLLLALKRDCVLWSLDLSTEDPDFDSKLQKLEEKGFHSYEQFCLQPSVNMIPDSFITILSILKQKDITTRESRKELLVSAIKERMGEYITVALSDKMRSRRGQYSDQLTLLNRYISLEKRLLKELLASVLKSDWAE
ncbi:hypothetical protein WA171_005460 [Blastocystis sp. BT1]